MNPMPLASEANALTIILTCLVRMKGVEVPAHQSMSNHLPHYFPFAISQKSNLFSELQI